MDIKTAERVKELLEQITSLSKINQDIRDDGMVEVKFQVSVLLRGEKYDDRGESHIYNIPSTANKALMDALSVTQLNIEKKLQKL